MIFAGDVPEGSLAQLMRANVDRVIDGAAEASRNTQDEAAKPTPVLSLAISSIGRRWVLGERSEEELDAAMEHLPGGSFQTGFYSFGELSPQQSGFCDLHNQTMTITTIFEE